MRMNRSVRPMRLRFGQGVFCWTDVGNDEASYKVGGQRRLQCLSSAMTSLSAGWRRLAASRLRGAMTSARRGQWTPTLRLRGLTRRGRFTSLEAGLVATLVTEILGGGRRRKETPNAGIWNHADCAVVLSEGNSDENGARPRHLGFLAFASCLRWLRAIIAASICYAHRVIKSRDAAISNGAGAGPLQPALCHRFRWWQR